MPRKRVVLLLDKCTWSFVGEVLHHRSDVLFPIGFEVFEFFPLTVAPDPNSVIGYEGIFAIAKPRFDGIASASTDDDQLDIFVVTDAVQKFEKFRIRFGI